MKYDTTYKVNHLKTKCHAIGSIWYPFKTYSFLFDKDCYSVRKHEQTRYKAVSIPLRNIIGCWCWISLKQYFFSVRFCHATFKPCYFASKNLLTYKQNVKIKLWDDLPGSRWIRRHFLYTDISIIDFYFAFILVSEDARVTTFIFGKLLLKDLNIVSRGRPIRKYSGC